jgi:hypothetical protein
MRLHPPQRRRLDTAVLDALASFYRTQHTLIRDAITTAQTQHKAAHTDRRAELAAVEAELIKTGQAIDRYLAAFEHGTIDENLVADRLTQLRTKTTQLRARREELTRTLDDEPTTPEPATLTQIANHITEIITSGTHNQTKALVEALIAKVTITAPDRLIPVFRIPQSSSASTTATDQAPATTPQAVVRTMTKSVELLIAYSHSVQAPDLRFCRTMALVSPVRAPSPSAKPPWSLRERLDERDITELITAYRNGATADSLATKHDVSLSSVKRLLHSAGVRRTPPTPQSTKATPTGTHT